MFEGYVGLVVLLAMVAVKGYALVNACLWPAAAFTLVRKQTKGRWLLLLGTGFLVELLEMAYPIGWLGSVLSLGFLVAALVYILDVRPAVHAVTRRI